MCKLIEANFGRYVFHNAGLKRFIERVQERVLRHVINQVHQNAEPELPADQNRSGEHLVASLGESVQSSANNLSHTFGYPNLPRRCSALCPGSRCDVPFLNQESDCFCDE